MNNYRLMIVISIWTGTALAGGPWGRGVDGTPIALDPSSPLEYHLETGALNVAYGQAQIRTMVANAFATWSGVAGSRLEVNEGPQIERDVNDLGDAAGLLQSGLNLVLLDEDGSMLQLLGLGPEDPGLALPTEYDGNYYRQFLLALNGPALLSYNRQELEAVLLQMVGHAIGLGQSVLNGDDYALGRPSGEHGVPPFETVEVMHPGLSGTSLTTDDISGLLALYGETAQGAAGRGAISGRIIMSDGITPAAGVNVIVRSLADGASYFSQSATTVSLPYTGSFSIVGLPPGTYSLAVADIARNNTGTFSDLIRTDDPETAHKLFPFAEMNPKLAGPFPGVPECYNGVDESADPERDDPDLFTAIEVKADQTVKDIEVVFNRNPQKPYSQLLYAWISNRADAFESILIANNYGDENLPVTLMATRASGERETVTRTIPAGGFLRENASSLFPKLGSGPGYSVVLSAPGDKIRGRWVTQSLRAASGASPSQGVAVLIPQGDTESGERVGRQVMFGYLPYGQGLTSAPVVINAGKQTANVRLRFYNKQGREVGRHTIEKLPPHVPFAQVIDDIVPDNREDLCMIAESDNQWLTGVSFVFDQVFFETAIGNVTALETEVPAPGPKRLMFPWISHRSGLFESVIVVNNYGDETLTIDLTARRANGQTESRSITIDAFGFHAGKVSQLFPDLGSGDGFALELVSPSSRVTGQWVTHNLAATSGQSPAQGVAAVIPESPTPGNERAGMDLLLGYLPLSGDLTSAPVLVNLGAEAVDVVLRFYDQRGNLLLEDGTSMTNLPPLMPVAALANSLLPEHDGDVYLVASSHDHPITGVVFVFDSRHFEPAIGNGSAVAPKPPPSTVYAIDNVNVVPMDEERILADQTVIVRDRLIAAMGPSTQITVPENAVHIDGSGKYLMPGLTDAHTHIRDEGDLVMNIANGVTSILNMGDSSYEMPRMKARLEAGSIQGPTIYAAMFVRRESGEVHLTPTTEEETRLLVRQAKEAGYDFVKAYENDRAGFDVIMNEAATQELAVIGHIPHDVELAYILAGGLSMIAHAEEYWNDFFDLRANYANISNARETTLRHGGTVTTSLSTVEAILYYGSFNEAGYGQILQRPGVSFLNPSTIDSWNMTFYLDGDFISQQAYNFMHDFIKDFNDHGVSLILGTDAPSVPGIVSGFAIHEELRVLDEAGWRPYDSLRAGTANVGAFINSQVPGSEPFGTVATGNRADLILLHANPLEDVAHVRERVGVMVRGQWFDENRLQQMLAEVAASYQQ